MKKIFTIMAVLSCWGIGANAQNLTFGVKAGLSVANITNTDRGASYYFDDASSFVGFNAGAFAEYKFNRWFGISPEVVYSRQGVNSASLRFFYMPSPQSAVAGISSADVRLNYINVPVLAKIYLAKWLSIDLGPQVGFLAGVNIMNMSKYMESWHWNFITGAPEYYPEYYVDASEYRGCFKKVDFGLLMGLTANFNKHIFLQGRYNLGLTNISKNKESVDTDIAVGGKHNSVFQVNLCDRFGYGR